MKKTHITSTTESVPSDIEGQNGTVVKLISDGTTDVTKRPRPRPNTIRPRGSSHTTPTRRPPGGRRTTTSAPSSTAPSSPPRRSTSRSPSPVTSPIISTNCQHGMEKILYQHEETNRKHEKTVRELSEKVSDCQDTLINHCAIVASGCFGIGCLLILMKTCDSLMGLNVTSSIVARSNSSLLHCIFISLNLCHTIRYVDRETGQILTYSQAMRMTRGIPMTSAGDVSLD